MITTAAEQANATISIKTLMATRVRVLAVFAQASKLSCLMKILDGKLMQPLDQMRGR
jgi:hypothetical protein